MRVPVMPDGFPRAGWILRAGGAVALLLGCALSTAAGAQTPRAGTDASAPEDPRLRQYLPPVPSVHPYMKGDQRLSKKVTMASADVTMSELLAELSKQTGIPLSAAKEVAEDAVTAGFRERPLAEVLALLSTHFGFTWRKKANGYEIWQDLRSLQREQLLRERENWELIARGIELGRLARRATPEARERRMEELRSPGTAPTAAMSPADLREHMDLNAVQGSGGTALAALAGLPQLRLQQLARADVVRLSTGDGSLAPAIAAELERLRMKKQPAAAVNRARPAPARWEVLLEIRGDGYASSRSLQVFTWRITPHGSSGSGGGVSTGGARFVRQSTPDDPRLQRPVRLLPRPPLPQLTHGPGAGAWRLDQTRWPDVPTLGELLLAIHTDTGLDVLADSFTFQRLRLRTAEREGAASANATAPGDTAHSILKEALSRLGLVAGVRGDLLRVRSQAYADARRGQTPPSLMRRAVARMQPNSEVYLDLVGELVDELTPEQQQELLRSWGYYWRNDRILVPAPSLHLSGSLDFISLLRRLPAAARSGSGLDPLVAWLELPPQAREQLLTTLARPGRDRPFVPLGAGGIKEIRARRTVRQSVSYVRYDASGRITLQSTVGFAAGAARPDPPTDANGQAYAQLGETSETVSVSVTVRYETGWSTHLGSIAYETPVLLPPLPPRSAGGAQADGMQAGPAGVR